MYSSVLDKIEQGRYPRSLYKIIVVMQLTVVMLFAACLTVRANAYAQKVTIVENKASLKKIFREIKEQTGYSFIYAKEDIVRASPVTIHMKDADVKDVLQACFASQPLTYSISNGIIVVKPGPVLPAKAALPQKRVSGVVTDSATGQPLAGVTVKVKGSNRGTTTGTDGRFNLTVSDGAVLMVSYLGYASKEIPVGEKSSLEIVLAPATTGLNQLVVVGYGTQKKQDITGAISTFKPTAENARPVLSPNQMLQGRMPGVMMVGTSGMPGSSNTVRIRGIGSLSASNDPLYVIDGVPINNHNAVIADLGQNMDPLAQINPGDIKSIEVLKDAAASAIYGSRATNGVVIITTRSGEKGRGKITLNAYTGFQQIPRMNKLKMVDADGYVAIENEAINNYNLQYGYHPGMSNYVEHIYNPYPGMGTTNWQNEVTRTAKINNVDLSFSGGSDKGTYYISGSYMDQQGVILTNNYKKYTGKINLNRNVNDWLKVGANTFFSYSRNNRVPGSNRGSSIWLRSLAQRPFDRPYKPDGSYYVGGTDDLIFHNPFQILNERDSYTDAYRLIGNAFAQIKFLKNFTFKSSFGTDLVYMHDYQHYTPLHPYGAGVGRVVDERRFISNLVWDNTLTYQKKVGKADLTVLAGHSFQREDNTLNSVEGRGFPSRAMDVISVASTIQDGSSSLSGNALESYFGRANVAWENKYLLALSMRMDGSSRFAPDNRWGYFPSVSAGWTMSNEDFWNWKNIDWKWKASYGNTGNQSGISQYAYQALMGGGYNYDEKSGLAVTTFGNDKLTWESAQQFDVGIDMGYKGEMLRFTADYFIKNTTNLLYDKPIYATSGFTSITSNIGTMRNTGFEFSVSTSINLGQVKWNSEFNISFIRNKLTSLLKEDTLVIGGNRTLAIGKPVGSYYLYKQVGIYQSDEDVPQSFYDDNGVRAGDVAYEDVNGDGIINLEDRQVIGNSNPDFYGGWENTFRWKNFDLNVFLTYMEGYDVYAEWRILVSRLGNGLDGMLQSVVDDHWTGPGTSNTTPRAIYGQSWNTQNSTRWLEDGSFIRLRSLSLGYSLPKGWISRLNIEGARFYVQGDNLFLLTHYSGIDPEVTKTENPLFFGDDNFVLPQLRTVNFGVNITF